MVYYHEKTEEFRKAHESGNYDWIGQNYIIGALNNLSELSRQKTYVDYDKVIELIELGFKYISCDCRIYNIFLEIIKNDYEIKNYLFGDDQTFDGIFLVKAFYLFYKEKNNSNSLTLNNSRCNELMLAKDFLTFYLSKFPDSEFAHYLKGQIYLLRFNYVFGSSFIPKNEKELSKSEIEFDKSWEISLEKSEMDSSYALGIAKSALALSKIYRIKNRISVEYVQIRVQGLEIYNFYAHMMNLNILRSLKYNPTSICALNLFKWTLPEGKVKTAIEDFLNSSNEFCEMDRFAEYWEMEDFKTFIEQKLLRMESREFDIDWEIEQLTFRDNNSDYNNNNDDLNRNCYENYE
jgi:hypothetical protein